MADVGKGEGEKVISKACQRRQLKARRRTKHIIEKGHRQVGGTVIAKLNLRDSGKKKYDFD